MKTFDFISFTDNVKMMVKDIVKAFDHAGEIHACFYINKNKDRMTLSLSKRGSNEYNRIYVYKDMVNADNYDQYMLKYFNYTRSYIFRTAAI